ncbi:MAG: VPLPA-CTERM sorting domain-containing protein [Deltaproteobacteria bacterium]|nr:VPLPA-CTERM sorting domain-containing protein [Deltaproteobacteria bacterium]
MHRIKWVILGVAALLLLGQGGVQASEIWFVTYGGGTNSNLWTYKHDATPSLDDFTDRGALQGDYWTDIAFGPDGTLYGLKWAGTGGNASLYSIPLDDLSNPTLLVGGTGKNLNSLGWANGGMLSSDTSGNMAFFTNASGTWAMEGMVGTVKSAGDIEKAADGNTYAAGWDEHFYRVDVTDHTYSHTQLDQNGIGKYLYGLAFDRDTGIYYGFSNQGQLSTNPEGESYLYEIAFGSGDVTLTSILRLEDYLGDGSDDVWGATTSPVPIPGAVWLLGSSLFGLAALRRKTRG